MTVRSADEGVVSSSGRTGGLHRSGLAGAAAWVAGSIAFAVLATANGGGYRYGASDQAFYIPAVVHALDPSTFPRDGALIDVQARLMLVDELLAAVMRATGLRLEALFLLGYLASLAIIWIGLSAAGGRVYRSRWAVLALAAAFTLRYRIPRTSANSFEPYFHPRMLAFGLGLLAVAAFLRRRPLAAIVCLAVAVTIHVTTALWFGMLLGVAMLAEGAGLRRLAIAGGAAALALAVWITATGPLRGAWTTMDTTWLQAVSSKDSLFPTAWPVWAWALNLAFPAVLWWAHRVRAGCGRAVAGDAGLVWGATALVALFLATLPAVASGFSLLVQLQISRVFWLVAFLATFYLVDVAADPPGRRDRVRGRAAAGVALALVACSAARAAYVMLVEHPERPLFAVRAPDSSWEEAMRWLARQPADVHVLADPGHAWKYGTSVRVSARRDVLLEDVKDSAVAIYSREVGRRVVERAAAIGDFSTLTAERAAALARQYDLDFLVTTADLALPLAYRSGAFRVYELGRSSSAAPAGAAP
jgi:hypothetical protein